MKQVLTEGLAAMGVAASARMVDQLAIYGQMLIDWNQRVNLTAMTEPGQVAVYHFLDSATPLAAGLIPENAVLADVGTGAGFPGLVLAILRPDLAVTLIEATGKKVTFLEAVIERLGLVGVRALHLRGEEAARQPAFRENFSVVTARAVAALPTLLEVTLPLVQVGGRLVALKGPSVEEEVAAARKATALLGAAAGRVIPCQVPGSDRTHRLAVYEKRQKSPSAYPRAAGKPQKQPLV
ncbi:MAG: 16S rRNA (guanine(527)-N(7))-methyltransferase RsmG [Christensenellales bacterium]|jgi:16S rRNA (guanine527-N7)-methyltransferase